MTEEVTVATSAADLALNCAGAATAPKTFSALLPAERAALLLAMAQNLENEHKTLAISLHAEAAETLSTRIAQLETERTGGPMFNGYPTGVAVTWSQHHGDPFPAAACLFPSLGASTIRRSPRPIAYQECSDGLLSPHLQDRNLIGLPRRGDGKIQEALQMAAAGGSGG
jgi:hypothetical protein